MLDIQLIRERPDFVKEQIRRLRAEAPIDEILALDESRRQILGQLESLRAQVNASSKQIGRTRD
ncbi:MAG: serine--tRNA ligase, partial [Chloroflexia bacterium]|nr:serine--tRNA ligase [Chloroflexia bacterium]